MHSETATLVAKGRSRCTTPARTDAPRRRCIQPARRAWTTAELARDWSPDDPYDRWPVAIAVSDAGSLRPALIHELRRREAVVVVPGSPVSTQTVPIAALVPLADMHEAPRQFCVAAAEHAAPATLDHFAAEWKAATFAAVDEGRLVEPLEMW